MGPLPRVCSVAPLFAKSKSEWSAVRSESVCYRIMNHNFDSDLCRTEGEARPAIWYCMSICQVSVLNSAEFLPEIWASFCSSLISCAIIQEGHILIQTPFQTWMWPTKRVFATQMRWSVTNTPVESSSPQTRHFLSRDKHCHGRRPEVSVCHIR